MKEIFESQLFALVVGAVLTIITSIVVNKRSYVDSLNEKIAEERIAAYKNVYKLIAELNHSLAPKEDKNFPDDCYLPYMSDGENEYRLAFCFPSVFLSFETFHNYKKEFAAGLNENRIYLNQPILNKLFFLDSYLAEIWNIASEKNDEYLQMMGFLLANEIGKLRDAVEKDIQEFFFTGKIKTSRSNFREPYKFVQKYMKETEFFAMKNELERGKRYGELPLCNNCPHVKNCSLTVDVKCDS